MATTTQSKASHDIDAAAERIRELNEQILDFGRKAGVQFLDTYESTLKTYADYQDKVADQSQVEWIASYWRAQFPGAPGPLPPPDPLPGPESVLAP